MPKMDALFQQRVGWIGGDGVTSVSLTKERTLWLFSDTWTGSVRNHQRTNATLVNNTLALQEGMGTNAKMQFIVRHDAGGKPTAFVTPADQQGWFWLQSGALVNQQLFIFLPQFEKTGKGGAFGFRQVGQWIGVVTNPSAPPLDWKIEQRQLPCATFSTDEQMSFGAVSLMDGNYLYIYGTDDSKVAGKRERYLLVARVLTNEVADFSAWRYFADGKWESDWRKASHLAENLATEFSVTFLPKFDKYVLVYTERGLSPKIQARTASAPWGEWSAAQTIYHCPEMDRDKNVFSYAAKAHPSQAGSDEMVISYVVNSFNFSQVISDADLYWPRFVRVQLTTLQR